MNDSDGGTVKTTLHLQPPSSPPPATFLFLWHLHIERLLAFWGCKDCSKVKAGGAYTMNTANAVTVRSTIRRLREQTES
ncbi:Putative 60S ribosomal protein L37a-1 [Linum perenne]